MKFVHIADIHFDSPFTFLKSNGQLNDYRKIEHRNAFKKVIEYIKENKIPLLFISGDLYEHEYVTKNTIEFINNLFKTITETKIFISPGNHDPFIKNSYYSEFNWNNNVFIFTDNINYYELEQIDIYGYGFNDFYSGKINLEQIKIKNKNKKNILVIHGELNASEKSEKQYNPLNESELTKLGFDYIALGHIHKKMIKPNIAYPGSLISFGFDEIGEHGMIIGEINENVNLNFVKIDNKEFVEKEIDISDIYSEEDLIDKITNENYKENEFYKINLTGNKNFEINCEKVIKLINLKNILKIKNKTKMRYDLDEIAKDNNLKGICIKEMLNMLKENEGKKEIIEKATEIILQNLI